MSKEERKKSVREQFQSPFAARQSREFRWSHLNYQVIKKKEPIRILNDTWGVVPGGQICCILGPSGAGKSSLLNVLAGRVLPGQVNKISGVVTVGSNPINPSAFKQQIAYVMQDDNLVPTLTVRESLRFSAALRIPKTVSQEQKDSLVETMIEELGLSNCADTLVGGGLLKGISGGQKKRTAVGIELVTNPSLLFLDEPTSGLDSFSAHQCIALLKKVAGAGCTVLCTIHQPSSEVFQMFDRCIFMGYGHVVYQGPIPEIDTYCSERGLPMPDNFNPSDHMMSVIQTNSLQSLKEKKFVMDVPKEFEDDVASTLSEAIVSIKTANNGIFFELRWLLWRKVLSLKRDVPQLIAKFALPIIFGLLFGLIFQGAGGKKDGDPDNFSSHFGAITMVSINSMFLTAQAVLLTLPLERPIFLREYSTGTYSSSSFFLSNIFTELPLDFLRYLLLVIIIYWLMELQGNFIFIVFNLFLLGSACASFAMLAGAFVKNAKTATEAAPLLFVPQILFAGFFVRISQIPVFLRWAQYLCSLKYSVNLFILIEFQDCPASQTLFCEGLKNDNEVYEDRWWVYVLINLAIFFGFRILSLLVLKKKADSFY